MHVEEKLFKCEDCDDCFDWEVGKHDIFINFSEDRAVEDGCSVSSPVQSFAAPTTTNFIDAPSNNHNRNHNNNNHTHHHPNKLVLSPKGQSMQLTPEIPRLFSHKKCRQPVVPLPHPSSVPTFVKNGSVPFSDLSFPPRPTMTTRLLSAGPPSLTNRAQVLRILLPI